MAYQQGGGFGGGPREMHKAVCGECKKEFEVKDNDVKSNILVQKQLDEFLYLSGEELSLKKQIENSIQIRCSHGRRYDCNRPNKTCAAHVQTSCRRHGMHSKTRGCRPPGYADRNTKFYPQKRQQVEGPKKVVPPGQICGKTGIT